MTIEASALELLKPLKLVHQEHGNGHVLAFVVAIEAIELRIPTERLRSYCKLLSFLLIKFCVCVFDEAPHVKYVYDLSDNWRILSRLKRYAAVFPANSPKMVIEYCRPQKVWLCLAVDLQLLIHLGEHEDDELLAVCEFHGRIPMRYALDLALSPIAP